MFLSLIFSHQIVSCIAAGEIAVQAAVPVLGSWGFLDGSQLVICLGNCDLGNFGLSRGTISCSHCCQKQLPALQCLYKLLCGCCAVCSQVRGVCCVFGYHLWHQDFGLFDTDVRPSFGQSHGRKFLGLKLSQASSQHCHLHGCGTSGLFVSSSAYYLRAFFWNSKRITSTRVSPTKKHWMLPLCKHFSFQRKS